MTRTEFERRAVRDAEQRIGVPAGWWGTARKIYGPNGVTVFSNPGCTWTVRRYGALVSRHDSRSYAIQKARRLP